MRPPARLAAALSALALLALAGCAGDAEADAVQAEAAQTGPAEPAWTELPDAPLSPRTDSVAVWTGEEALFLGGSVDKLCPPNADCEAPVRARDGAAYDPADKTWRKVADAPVALAQGAGPAVVDGIVYLVGDRRLLAYDPQADAWTGHGRVREHEQWGLVPTGDGRLTFSGVDRPDGEGNRIYDPRTRTWTEMPAGPLGTGGWFTPTPEGLVQVTTTTQSIGREPDLLSAAVLDLDAMTWRRLPQGEQIGGYGWAWTGTRLTSATLGGADGGEVNPWPRWYPYGGTLEPGTGRWGPLPNAPENYNADGWAVSASGGRWTATGGWVYDDATESWTELPVPHDAPGSPGAAVWAGGELIAFGGVDWGTGDGRIRAEASNGAWSYPVSAAPPD